MGSITQVFALIITGIVLLWIGYRIFFGRLSPFFPFFLPKKTENLRGKAGDPHVCPICSMKLIKGDLVKSFAFPTAESRDRLMYIKGCFSCLEHDIPRKCPICKKKMSLQDYLVSRLFERKKKKAHIHIIGCNNCRGVGITKK